MRYAIYCSDSAHDGLPKLLGYLDLHRDAEPEDILGFICEDCVRKHRENQSKNIGTKGIEHE